MTLLTALLLFISGGLIQKSTANTAPVASLFFSTTSEIDKQPFTNWLLATDNASSYDHSIFLPTTADPTNGMATFWKITGGDNDENDASKFHLAFATMATGWAAFGIAEAGGMFGADVVSFTTANPTTLIDGYILDDRQVRVDTHSQDWTLVSSTVEDGWIIVEATRRIDTGDGQDNSLKNDRELWNAASRIIAAWGDTDVMSYHGDNRSSSSVRLFADPSTSSSSSSDLDGEEALDDFLEKNSDGYFDVVNDAYTIPAEETKYEYVCRSYDELKEQFGGGGEMTDTITMIGATPIITEETRQFVHHFIVMATPSCGDNEFFKREQIFGWAPGEQGMVLPDNVGFPMFATEDMQAIRIEIHYNNPKLISGMKDSSGVRFHYTSTPRLHEAAFLQLGDPQVGLYGEQITDGLTKHEFTCGGSCSSLFLDEPVTVISEKLHMHKTGTRMVNEVIRGDEVVHMAKVEVYDFDQQGSFQPQQDAYQLQAGDKFRTTCYYKDGTEFGLGSQEEMCIGFLLYYPAKKYAGFPFGCPYPGRGPCTEEYVSTDLNDYEELGRTFGIGTPGLPVTSIEPPTPAPSNSNVNTGSGSGENVPAFVPIPIPTPTNQDTDTETESPMGMGMGENVPAFVPIPTPTSQDTETESPTSKAEFMQAYCLYAIALSSAVMVITFV